MSLARCASRSLVARSRWRRPWPLVVRGLLRGGRRRSCASQVDDTLRATREVIAAEPPEVVRSGDALVLRLAAARPAGARRLLQVVDARRRRSASRRARVELPASTTRPRRSRAGERQADALRRRRRRAPTSACSPSRSATGFALQLARPLEEVDDALDRLRPLLVLGVAGRCRGRGAARALVARRGAAPGPPPHASGRRSRGRDPGPRPPHRRRRPGRARPPRGRASTRCWPRWRTRQQRPAPAGRRRLPRAAHAADQPAHQHRGAARASASCRPSEREQMLRDVVGAARGAERPGRRAWSSSPPTPPRRLETTAPCGWTSSRRRRSPRPRRLAADVPLRPSSSRPPWTASPAPRARHRQPAGQRREVEPAGAPRSTCAWPRGDRGARPRARHRRRRPAARVRPLLPRAVGARPAGLRPRALRSCGRSSRPARRHRDRGAAARGRHARPPAVPRGADRPRSHRVGRLTPLTQLCIGPSGRQRRERFHGTRPVRPAVPPRSQPS